MYALQMRRFILAPSQKRISLVSEDCIFTVAGSCMHITKFEVLSNERCTIIVQRKHITLESFSITGIALQH